KMVAGIQAQLGAAPPEMKSAFDLAAAASRESFWLRADGKEVPAELQERVAQLDEKVLRPIRGMLGLDHVSWGATGAAPIPVDILEFLAGLGIDVLEVWGMTETTGTATINLQERFRPGTVGRPNAGMEIRIAEDG